MEDPEEAAAAVVVVAGPSPPPPRRSHCCTQGKLAAEPHAAAAVPLWGGNRPGAGVGVARCCCRRQAPSRVGSPEPQTGLGVSISMAVVTTS